jgi:hypothetical protein
MKGGQNNRSRSVRPRERHISVRSVRRDPPDLRKLSRALLAIALAEAEAQAQTEKDKAKPGREESINDSE